MFGQTERDSKTDRQTGRQADGRKDRQTDRQKRCGISIITLEILTVDFCNYLQ